MTKLFKPEDESEFAQRSNSECVEYANEIHEKCCPYKHAFENVSKVTAKLIESYKEHLDHTEHLLSGLEPKVIGTAELKDGKWETTGIIESVKEPSDDGT